MIGKLMRELQLSQLLFILMTFEVLRNGNETRDEHPFQALLKVVTFDELMRGNPVNEEQFFHPSTKLVTLEVSNAGKVIID